MQAAYLRHLFPKVVSYNRLVELEREVTILLTLFIKKVLLGKCTGISFVDSTPLRVCRNQRIHIHKVFKGINPKRQMLHGMVLRLQAASNLQWERRDPQLYDNTGDVDDRKPLEYKTFVEFMYGKLCLFRILGKSIHNICKHKIYELSNHGKNCFYRMMIRPQMDWRRLETIDEPLCPALCVPIA